MRYVAAYLLASLSGKEPSKADIEKILGSVGVDIDDDKLSKVCGELKGKNIEDVLTKGRAKLASMPSAGAAVAATAAAPAASAPAAEKKEEKKPAKEESDEGSDDDMGFGLFD